MTDTSAPVVIRGDARGLPLPDGSVDLIVTSPPYWSLRSYTDGGEHYGGQIGAEPAPAAYVDSLIECTREWVRVLKPSGSLWVNLGDKYNAYNGNRGPGTIQDNGPRQNVPQGNGLDVRSIPAKSLIGLPWRYAIRCVDDLGLILRAEVIWSKPNGLPESVTDRVRRSHEQWFHLVKQPRYYTAVDRIREAYDAQTARRYETGYRQGGASAAGQTANGALRQDSGGPAAPNPLGKLPGSVWEIATQPLKVPAELGVDHFAAFPMEWPRRIIQGWSPSGICTACGEGRRPVVDKVRTVKTGGKHRGPGGATEHLAWGVPGEFGSDGRTEACLTGEACACTPYTDHPRTGGSSGAPYGAAVASGQYVTNTNGQPRDTTHPGKAGLWGRPKVGPWREYHFDQWTPPPTRPAVVLDPFGGTGTVALVARALGRRGVSVDMSADYCRLAAWRTSDPGEMARALGVAKPAAQMEGQSDLFDLFGSGSPASEETTT